ncbi:MAG: hypothetical protein KatS3mg016_1125 [Fimbriimonadales bacterium]|nr:MAG: hypothetical protein KatS3mg016_1125 [Fimbriimonadales bacterium]
MRLKLDENLGESAVLRLPAQASLQDILALARSLIAGLKSTPIEGQLWIVQRGRIRRYSGR